MRGGQFILIMDGFVLGVSFTLMAIGILTLMFR